MFANVFMSYNLSACIFLIIILAFYILPFSPSYTINFLENKEKFLKRAQEIHISNIVSQSTIRAPPHSRRHEMQAQATVLLGKSHSIICKGTNVSSMCFNRNMLYLCSIKDKEYVTLKINKPFSFCYSVSLYLYPSSLYFILSSQ